MPSSYALERVRSPPRVGFLFNICMCDGDMYINAQVQWTDMRVDGQKQTNGQKQKWLVETVSLNQACKAILFYSGGGLFGQDLGGFCWFIFFHVFGLCSGVCRSFAISFCPVPGKVL